METIYKYPLEITDTQDIPLRNNGQILTVQMQEGRPCIWARVNTDDPEVLHEKRTILTYGTGHPIEQKNIRYIGTYQVHARGLVFHVFEQTDETDLPH